MAALLMGLGCSSPRPVEGVWRPGPGEDTEHIPGPMQNFGPFDSYADALKAACPLILSKPNATVGYLQASNPELARRTATEYCAWLYYTPEHQYEMSMLTDQPRPEDLVTGKKSCKLPTFVSDSRYAPDDLRYIFALHNHPYGTILSPEDTQFIEAIASIHEWSIEVKGNRNIYLSIIAFFSRSKDPSAPSCDGFYQYVPATRTMTLWTQTQGNWQHQLIDPKVWDKPKPHRINGR